jgi:hypothetical protein
MFEKQTLARAYAQLTSGTEEAVRVAIGDFMNEFFLYSVSERQSLLDDPIQMPEHPTEDQRGWAAFCAGAAEYLASRYDDLTCPAWALDPTYTLTDPWYHPASKAYPRLREHFEETAPDAFRKRNVLCSDRIFTNAHSSSHEPGTLTDLYRERLAVLADLPADERDAYLLAHQAKMRGKPRYRIVA